MIVYSELFCDGVSIEKEIYDEFYQQFKTSPYFEESRVNDLIYYIFDISKELGIQITKKKLLLKIADIVKFIELDVLINLKHYELKRLLNATGATYHLVLENVISDEVIVDEPKKFETVDPE